MSALSSPSSSPSSSPQGRWTAPDLVRGFALLGILLANMPAFSEPLQEQLMNLKTYDRSLDQWVYTALQFAVQGKFYPLFSFLFGFGFVMIMKRAEQQGRRPVPLMMRRLLFLLFLGLAHAVLLWWGDVLFTYAVAGFVLLLFRRSTPRTLVIWAAVLAACMTIIQSAVVGLASLSEAVDPGSWTDEMRKVEERYLTEADAARSAYAGSYADAMRQRLRDLAVVAENLPFAVLSVLPMFLVGAAWAAAGGWQRAERDRRWLLRLWAAALAAALPLSVVKYACLQRMDWLHPSSYDILYQFCVSFGDPAASLWYAFTLVLLGSARFTRGWRQPLIAAGRFSLSLYLMQTVVCTTIFYGYGGGQFGRWGPAALAALALAIYAFQLAAAVMWSRRFAYGPAEWLWRAFTYGRMPVFADRKERPQ